MTCQICGRAIRAPKGRVAHHGYTRPYQQGWQSASCLGATWRPYEVACDALPPAIRAVELFLESSTAALWRLEHEPPAELTLPPRGGWGGTRPAVVVQRPEGFVPGKKVHSYQPGTYENAYRRRVDALEASIRGARADLEHLRKRLADWRPV